MLKLLMVLFLSLPIHAHAAVCEGQNCQVIMFDDFNGPTYDEDPACYTKTPVCTPRPEWSNSGACKNLNADVVIQLAQLNKCRWKVWDGYGFYGQQNTFSFLPKQVKVDNGILTLTGEPANNGVKIGGEGCKIDDYNPKCAFVSGGIDSRPSFGGEHPGFDFRYGKVEIRAKFDMGPGAFPALWMFDSREVPLLKRKISDTNEKYQEIDILEVFPNEPFTWRDPWKFWVENMSNVRIKAYQTLHWGEDGTKKDFINDYQAVNKFDWHTYVVEWEPNKLTFSIDGKETHTITDRDSKNGRKVRIPNHEMYLMLDMQLDRGKFLKNFFKKDVLHNDISQLTHPVRMHIDWIKVTSKKSTNTPIMPFPHPPLVPGIKYWVEIVENKVVPVYEGPCDFGGKSVGTNCHLAPISTVILPKDVPYLVRTDLANGGPGIYYVSAPIETKTCPYGGAFIKTVGGEYLSFAKSTLYKNLCRLALINPTGPVLVPGVPYSILAPQNGQGFGIYYPQVTSGSPCPYGGRVMDLHEYYGSWWWIPSCQVMQLDSSKVDPLRSVEILMHQDPRKRIIRYRNDY